MFIINAPLHKLLPLNYRIMGYQQPFWITAAKKPAMPPYSMGLLADKWIIIGVPQEYSACNPSWV